MKANRTTSSRRPNERGQSLVELAISLTVMLLLLAGAVTFGMALFSYVAMRDAAQEGALWGSFNPYQDATSPPTNPYAPGDLVNYQAICGRVQNASRSPLDMTSFGCTNTGTPPNPSINNIDVQAVLIRPDGTVTLSGIPPCEGPPSTTPAYTTADGVFAMQVIVTYNFPVFMPFMGTIVGDHIPLTAKVTDTILEPKCP